MTSLVHLVDSVTTSALTNTVDGCDAEPSERREAPDAASSKVEFPAAENGRLNSRDSATGIQTGAIKEFDVTLDLESDDGDGCHEELQDPNEIDVTNYQPSLSSPATANSASVWVAVRPPPALKVGGNAETRSHGHDRPPFHNSVGQARRVAKMMGISLSDRREIAMLPRFSVTPAVSHERAKLLKSAAPVVSQLESAAVDVCVSAQRKANVHLVPDRVALDELIVVHQMRQALLASKSSSSSSRSVTSSNSSGTGLLNLADACDESAESISSETIIVVSNERDS